MFLKDDRMAIKGIQLNLRKSMVATQNLLKKCENVNNSILFLQEPSTVRKKVYLHPNLKLHYHNCDQVRAVIAYTKNLNIMGMPHFTDKDIVTCLMENNDSSKTVLISAYWDILVNEIPRKLTAAIEWANRKGHMLVLCMDSNAHSTIWGSPANNTRGNTLEDFIAVNDLNIANTGHAPTFRTYRENRIIQSIIDLTITSSVAPFIVKNWRISDTYEGSDHRMIHFTFGTKKCVKKTVLNYGKCRWYEFREKLQNGWEDQPVEWDRTRIDKEAEYISDRINKALEQTCPRTVERHKVKLGFWNEELHKEKHEHRASHHKMIKERTAETIHSYKEKRREYKKLLRRAKRKEWQDRTSNITNYRDMAKFSKTTT
jgi:hypothetical protein